MCYGFVWLKLADFIDGSKFRFNIVNLLIGDLYDLITEEEREQLISHLIQEIQIYPEGESECPLKSIKFNFPVINTGKK